VKCYYSQIIKLRQGILKTIGHHTCKKDGGENHVLEESPFFAEHNLKENKIQFVGSGYYFWDNNIDLAKTWGRGHYNDDYYVIEIDFELTTDNCFDLVGNRSHQIHLINALRQYESETGRKKDNWTLNQCIQFLKELNKVDANIFPFKFVRAIDLLNHVRYAKAQLLMNFTNEKENYTIINPKIIICAFEKEDLILHSKRIVASS
jgi:hypothetical protein